MGLQISLGLGDEVSLLGIGRRYWSEVPRVVARDSAKQRDDYLCGVYQQGSCASSDRHTSELISIQGSAVSEREEFSQNADGVSSAKKEILGSAFVGKRLLGSFERKCDRRSLESVHRKPEAK